MQMRVPFIPTLPTILLAGMTGAHAQEPVESGFGVTVTDGGSRVIYGPQYFTPYNVVTAGDQLERIPGMQEVLEQGGEEERGFGNAGAQILINGKRLAGKSNDVGSALERIQARQVLRIEVIRGTVAGLDVRSQGRVVNIVLDGALVTGVGSWQASVEDYSDSSWGGGGEVSYNGNFASLSYLMSAAVESRKNLEDRTDLFMDPAGVAFERQDEAFRERSEEYTFTANTSYAFVNGDLLNLNGRYAEGDEAVNEGSNRFQLVPAERFANELYTFGSDVGDEWELGGDYEHTLGNGNVFTGLFVFTSGTGAEDNRFRVTEAGEFPFVREIQSENTDEAEKIVRGTYLWGRTETRSIQSGAEFALNTVEQRVQLQEDSGSGLLDVPLFNQDSTVEEKRLELFSTYTWQPRASLLVEGSLDLEFSELGQEGSDVSRSRDLFFARPRLVARYDITPLVQVRGRIERRVDQLDFSDFVSSFSNDDNRVGIISAGNPELVPEQAWEYELAYEYRLPNDLGVMSVTGLYSDVRDRVSSVPLLVRDANGVEEVRTATGNIDSGRAIEVTANGSVRLAALGLRTAVVEGGFTWRDTSIEDPFTGVVRRFSDTNDYSWSIGFRHDTSWRNLSYGVTASQDGPFERYDIDYSDDWRLDPDVELFVEVRPVENLTLLLSIEQALRADTLRERLQFVGQRRLGQLDRLELRDARPGREITLSVRGVF
ncbi:MAG TPA: TonB-dependent receptor [Pseudomonadales bacterium]